MKEFTISDTHFGHTNIIKYCKRPFINVEVMNQYLIDAWNSVVGKQDTVYHAGDFGFGPKEFIADIVSQLNGNIILVEGNHDKFSRTKIMECGFAGFHKGSLTIGDLIITHRPLESVSFGTKNIHGHTHNTYIEEIDTDYHINVSADVLGFKPYPLERIIAGDYVRLTPETGLPRQNPQGRH